MIAIFGEQEGWTDRINFVDDNNVLVGFGMYADCCEYFGWFISEESEGWKEYKENEDEFDLSTYQFDPNFFTSEPPEDQYDEGGKVVFRMISENGPDLYLHLFNVHNGYYAHGFSMKINGKIKKSGSL